MVLRVLLVSLAIGAGMMISSRALAHPGHAVAQEEGGDRRMVIANYPIEVVEPAAPMVRPVASGWGGTGKRTVIANYPIETTTEYRVVSTTVLPPETIYTGYVQAAAVPTPMPMPAAVPAAPVYVETAPQIFVEEREILVPQPVYVPDPQPLPQAEVKPVVVHRPVQAPTVRTRLNPFDCICARSASGKPVKVYKVASHRARTAVAKVGGGKLTVDVRGFHQGHWRVAYHPEGQKSKIDYGWVREADLICKETRVFPVRY